MKRADIVCSDRHERHKGRPIVALSVISVLTIVESMLGTLHLEQEGHLISLEFIRKNVTNHLQEKECEPMVRVEDLQKVFWSHRYLGSPSFLSVILFLLHI